MKEQLKKWIDELDEDLDERKIRLIYFFILGLRR